MYEKNALYYFQISLFVPEISQFLKYANNSSDDAINSTEYEKLHSLQKDSTTCTPQYDYTGFVTMATFFFYLITFKSGFFFNFEHCAAKNTIIIFCSRS